MQPEAMHAQFSRALLDPAAPVPEGLTCPAGGSVARRFGIYRNNVTVSLIEALRAQFPATERLLGEERFRFLARDYLRADPPRDAFLGLWGEGFADYLARSEHVTRHPFVPDVTRVEYAFARALHAQDMSAIDVARLGAVAPEALEHARLRFHPAAVLTASTFPAVTIFLDNRSPEEPPPRSLAVAECGLITRPEMTVKALAITPGEFAFFSALQNGAPLGEAADAGSAADPSLDFASALGRLFGAGAVADVVADKLFFNSDAAQKPPHHVS